MTIIYNSNVFGKELVFSGLVVQSTSGQRTSRSRADNGKYLKLGFVVVLLFYVYGKHLRSCRDGQLT